MATVHVWAPGLHFNTATNRKRVRLYWIAFAAMFTYEIIPSYMFPLLNGINVFCLASQHASPSVQNIFTNIFGGSNNNEGLGLFSLSFDWQYITSVLVPSADDVPVQADDAVYRFMTLPLILQVNVWVGTIISYFAIPAIYYSNTWNVTAKFF